MADALAAIEIRRAVSAARRLYPEADIANVADYCIARDVPIGLVKGILFDVIVTATAADAGVAAFRRAPLTTVLRATRRRA